MASCNPSVAAKENRRLESGRMAKYSCNGKVLPLPKGGMPMLGEFLGKIQPRTRSADPRD